MQLKYIKTDEVSDLAGLRDFYALCDDNGVQIEMNDEQLYRLSQSETYQATVNRLADAKEIRVLTSQGKFHWYVLPFHDLTDEDEIIPL